MCVFLQVRGVSPCCTMKAVLSFLELYLHDAPDDDEDALSIDAASYSSRTTTSTSGACGVNDSPNTSAVGAGVGGGVHGQGVCKISVWLGGVVVWSVGLATGDRGFNPS